MKHNRQQKSKSNEPTQSIEIPSQYERDKEIVRNYISSQPYLAYDNYTSDIALAELRIKIHEMEHELKYYWVGALLDGMTAFVVVAINIVAVMNAALMYFPMLLALVLIETLIVVGGLLITDINKYYELEHDLNMYKRQYRYWDRSIKFRL